MYRFKLLINPKPILRNDNMQEGEILVGVKVINKIIRFGMSVWQHQLSEENS